MHTSKFSSAEAFLGGAAVIHPLPRSVLDWVTVIRKGLSASAVEALVQTTHLSQAELASALGIPERTLVRRKREGVLSPDESAKLVRFARVLERAVEVFDGIDSALDWLKATNRALASQSPLSLLDTELGAECVLDTLGRIEHGVFN